MKNLKLEKIWKIRTVKDYPEAKNHIFVGKVVEINSSYVMLKCRTYHFGRSVNQPRDIHCGHVEIRLVPWGRIELVNLVDENFDYKKAELVKDEHNNIVIRSGDLDCVIYGTNDNRVF
ncbi:MAG: hypothetical protein ACIAQZ_01770 [Sedimentisphaeraceae bacterium JB056]